MLSAENLTAITIGFYLAASVLGLGGIMWRKGPWRTAGCWLALAAFCCQTIILIFGFHRLMPAGLSAGAYLQLLAWFSLLCGIGAWLRMRQDAILLFSAPFGLLLFLISAAWLHMPIALPKSLTTPFFALHIGALFLCLGLLAVACLGSLLFIILEQRIKAKKIMRGFWEDMPALYILDRINAVCVTAAFPLYTIGLAAGLAWSRPIFGSVLTGDVKEVVSLLVWALLAVLFYGRLVRGWRGRMPALLTAAIFAISLFSIIFVNLYLSSHHGYIRN